MSMRCICLALLAIQCAGTLLRGSPETPADAIADATGEVPQLEAAVNEIQQRNAIDAQHEGADEAMVAKVNDAALFGNEETATDGKSEEAVAKANDAALAAEQEKADGDINGKDDSIGNGKDEEEVSKQNMIKEAKEAALAKAQEALAAATAQDTASGAEIKSEKKPTKVEAKAATKPSGPVLDDVDAADVAVKQAVADAAPAPVDSVPEESLETLEDAPAFPKRASLATPKTVEDPPAGMPSMESDLPPAFFQFGVKGSAPAEEAEDAEEEAKMDDEDAEQGPHVADDDNAHQEDNVRDVELSDQVEAEREQK